MAKLLFTLIPALALTACQPSSTDKADTHETTSENQIKAEGVTNAWIRLPAVSGQPGVGYFEFTSGDQERTLISISSPTIATIEMHQSKIENGIASMSSAGEIVIPSRSNLTFEAGGNHAMLFGIDPSIAAGGTVTLILHFKDGSEIKTDAKVFAAGDAGPGSDVMDMSESHGNEHAKH